MAVIAPRVTVNGVAHRVEERAFEASGNRAARQYVEVAVLTDEGGLLPVRIDEKKIGGRPPVGTRVSLVCDYNEWAVEGRNGATFSVVEVLQVPGSGTTDAALHAVNE